jgi:hypothetical protein
VEVDIGNTIKSTIEECSASTSNEVQCARGIGHLCYHMAMVYSMYSALNRIRKNSRNEFRVTLNEGSVG